jgi:CBS domain-containing protein
MRILELCDPVVAKVRANASVAEAIREMVANRVGAVAVVDDHERLAGIFTERDVMKKLALSGRDPEQVPVRELMTTTVEIATEEMPASEALSVMVERHVRHLPIVDVEGHVLGLLSIRNLLQARVDELSHELDSVEQYMSNVGPGG